MAASTTSTPERELELEARGGPEGRPQPLAAVARGAELATVASLRTRRDGGRVSEKGTAGAEACA